MILAIDELRKTGVFSDVNIDTDEDEHSIEMHLPYVRKVFEGSVRRKAFDGKIQALIKDLLRLDIQVVPILVGAIGKEKEMSFGKVLAPHLARDDTFCIVSSDFCHW